MMTVIPAAARAAGEVAPLMLVGVVKLAPNLPVDGEFSICTSNASSASRFPHLRRRFQSPNVEAARPLVYATAPMLVILIILTWPRSPSATGCARNTRAIPIKEHGAGNER